MKYVNVSNVYRSFSSRGKTYEVLKDINFEINKGEIVGVLGPNGAGKTTLIKILSTMLLPTSGTVEILGKDAANNFKEIRQGINFVYGGEKGVYGKMTAFQYLDYFSSLYNVNNKLIHGNILELLELVGLENDNKKQIYSFSKGMVQRLHIARSLINNPKLLFLDEPTIGLDPDGAAKLREIIRKINQSGVTILLTTHYMQEADDLCNRVAFLNKGSILEYNFPSKLKEASKNYFVRYEGIFDMNSHNANISELKKLTNYSTETSGDIMIFKFLIEKNNIEHQQIINNIISSKSYLSLIEKELNLEDAYFYHFRKESK